MQFIFNQEIKFYLKSMLKQFMTIRFCTLHGENRITVKEIILQYKSVDIHCFSPSPMEALFSVTCFGIDPVKSNHMYLGTDQVRHDLFLDSYNWELIEVLQNFYLFSSGVIIQPIALISFAGNRSRKYFRREWFLKGKLKIQKLFSKKVNLKHSKMLQLRR